MVEQLLRAQAAVVVQNTEEMLEFARKCLQDNEYREDLGRRAQHVVQSQRGATKATVQLLLGLLENVNPPKANFSLRRSA